ncbi:MAG: ParB/RepB/Spo0J family partition protein [Chloroflexi bacterium]|nr:ParB/RepB/Spo0J family partition protein [Chloroflexota bacterium]
MPVKKSKAPKGSKSLPSPTPSVEEVFPDIGKNQGKAVKATCLADQYAKMENVSYLPLDVISPNPNNPRRMNFNGAFADLTASVKEKGVLQPIIVSPRVNLEGKEKYEIIAGERRWRAAAAASIETIPAIILDVTQQEVFEIMTIENLLRENLTEAEEAQSFKAYVDVKGDGAIEDLAQRSGISARYIRRRVEVLRLPKKILKDWEDGKIAFGVLEQLLRIDPEKVEKFYEIEMRYGLITVGSIKRSIDDMAISLKCAVFSLKDAGCSACGRNSEVQGSIFGDDFTGENGSCLNAACFIEHQHAYLTDNWEKTSYAKKNKTNGFVFYKDVKWNDFELFLSKENVFPDCEKCFSFVTALTIQGKVYHERCCLNPLCYKSKSRKPKGSGDSPSGKDNNHGVLFRESFYVQRIPEVARTQFAPDDDKVLRVILASLIHANHEVKEWFATSNYIPEPAEDDLESRYFYSIFQIWPVIEVMDTIDLRNAIREASLIVTVEASFGQKCRHAIATHLGIDLSRDWLLHEEYLNKKTIKEILDLGKDLGIFADEKATAYLAEVIKKKSVNQCKKEGLIRLILESGVDLSGKVPEEILKTK